jgi:hypothetical protein
MRHGANYPSHIRDHIHSEDEEETTFEIQSISYGDGLLRAEASKDDRTLEQELIVDLFKG